MTIDNAIAISIDGISCYDLGVEEEFGRHSPQVKRTLWCNWPDRIVLMAKLLGYATISGGIVSYNVPGVYPDAPWLYCQDVRIKGIGVMSVGAGGSVAYEIAELKLIYRPAEFSGDREIGNETLDFADEVIVPPGDGAMFTYQSDSQPLPPESAPPIRFSIVHFTKTISNAPELPAQTVMSLVDTVNDDLFLGAAAGKLKFNGARSARTFSAIGQPIYDVTYSFSYRSQEWNKVFRPKIGTTGGDWEDVLLIDTAFKLYPPADYGQFGFGE